MSKHIIMSFNSKFVLPACTTIYTLFLHNSDVILYIGYQDLTIGEMNCIKRFEKMRKDNFIRFIRLENSLEKRLKVDTGRWTTYTFNRFTLPEYIPENADRCLWLDADLMIRGDISEFYSMDFEENYFAGACEDTSNPLERLGFSDYINAGVLLMNLKRLRADNAFDRLWEFVLDPSFDYPLLDQDAINLVFRGQIKYVPEYMWNRVPLHFGEGKDENPDFEKADQARIVHFLSKDKPWLQECARAWDACSVQYPVTGKYYDEYLDYLESTMDFLEENGGNG